MLTHSECLYIIKCGLTWIRLNDNNAFTKLISFNNNLTKVVIATTEGSIDPNSIYIYRYQNNLWIREWYEKLYLPNNKIESICLIDNHNIEITTTAINLQYRLINDIWSLQQNMVDIDV